MSEPDGDAPKGRGFWRHRDLLAAIASGFVGALALATSTYNVYLQRQQVRAEVLPRLELGEDFTNGLLSISVQNRGVGPADVKWVRVTVDGKPAEDWVHALTMLLHEDRIPLPSISDLEGQVMSPGFEITALKIAGTSDSIEILAQRRRLAIDVCYCSTLGDCWLLGTTDISGPKTTSPVAACAPDPRPFRSISPETMDSILREMSRKPQDGGTGDAGQ